MSPKGAFANLGANKVPTSPIRGVQALRLGGLHVNLL